MLNQTEDDRRNRFPAVHEGIFFAHAAVAPVPAVAAEAMAEYAHVAARGNQETAAGGAIAQARADAAALLGTQPDAISLLGPTSLGLSMVARGLEWTRGDEVVYYAEDYPANVYPWSSLREFGVNAVALQPELPGVITWEVVEAALSPRTRLVALATCHFLSGYRIDIDTIGQKLHERGILFSLDGIQSLGAFPLPVEHVDFLSADSHKWLLGPCGAGVFYVSKNAREQLQPVLLGAGNVVSPEFVAQEEMHYAAGGVRYEPGVLNIAGIVGMGASLRMLLDEGTVNIAARLLHLRRVLVSQLREKGYQLYLEAWDTGVEGNDAQRSAIVTFWRRGEDMEAVFARLRANGVTASLRRNREGRVLIRFSPHFYNTEEEVARAVALL